MGTELADQISQGSASGNDWRTSPLWGLGQRLFFLHDGRISRRI
ncbi:MAG TPA: di-heme oxidoredictase family protein [Bryobacteraceae bacterium]